MPCAYTEPSADPLDFDRYYRLHPDGRQLIRQWYRRALDKGHQGGNFFESFIFLWISFNGFATCVTGIERDAEILKRVGKCPKLRQLFAESVDGNKDLAQELDRFVEYWPIFKVQDLRRLNLLHSTYPDRQTQVRAYLARRASHEPSCFEFHEQIGRSVPKDWPHVLHAIYRVRCNLFHGEKSPTAATDSAIVRLAYRVLALFMEQSKLLSA